MSQPCRWNSMNEAAMQYELAPRPVSGAPAAHRRPSGTTDTAARRARPSSFLGTWADVTCLWRHTVRGAREQPGHAGRGAHEEVAAAAARPLAGRTPAR